MAGRLALVLVGLWVLAPLGADPEVEPQTLTWSAVEGAGSYEVHVWSTQGDVLVQVVDQPEVSLTLAPGQYQYQVRVYNVLDQIEAETPTRTLLVLKAERPVPQSLTPGQAFVETPVKRFVLRGEAVVEGATIDLVRRGSPWVARATIARRGPGEWVLEFPGVNLGPGVYDLVVQNPGGLKAVLPEALRVALERAFDLRAAAGWVGGLPVLDPWYQAVWGSDFVPQGLGGRFDTVFVKQPGSQFGAGVGVSTWSQQGGTEGATLTSAYVEAGVDVFFTSVWSPQWRSTVRLGGGLTRSSHAFDYEGTPGKSWVSVDPYGAAEVNGSYWLTRWMYVETGVSLNLVFNAGYVAGLLRPLGLVGFSF